MKDLRIEQLANLLVQYSTAIKPGDKVLVQGSANAAPLLRAVYRAVLEAEGFPFLNISLPGLEEIFYRYASDDQLLFLPPPMLLAIETYDAAITILADENTRSLSRIDPQRIARYHQGRKPLMDLFMKRAADGALKWTVTLFPTNAYAQDAEMSLGEFTDFVYHACLPSQDDPIAYWQQFASWQERLCAWLQGKKQVRIVAPGTDLTLSIENRCFVSCDGRHNMPDGEIFTGPVEDSVTGQVSFTYPAIYEGREVAGVRLTFQEGKVVAAQADKNEDFLRQMLATDPGASYVGEFAIGTNEGITTFTREILFDEKIGGTFHLALGAGYPETGSKNRSAIHWDMIGDLKNGGKIWVDGQLMHENGKFIVTP